MEERCHLSARDEAVGTEQRRPLAGIAAGRDLHRRQPFDVVVEDRCVVVHEVVARQVCVRNRDRQAEVDANVSASSDDTASSIHSDMWMPSHGSIFTLYDAAGRASILHPPSWFVSPNS